MLQNSNFFRDYIQFLFFRNIRNLTFFRNFKDYRKNRICRISRKISSIAKTKNRQKLYVCKFCKNVQIFLAILFQTNQMPVPNNCKYRLFLYSEFSKSTDYFVKQYSTDDGNNYHAEPVNLAETSFPVGLFPLISTKETQKQTIQRFRVIYRNFPFISPRIESVKVEGNKFPFYLNCPLRRQLRKSMHNSLL